MKIAVVTEDQRKISGHFGRAPMYMVYTVEDGQIVNKEAVAKPAHHHGSHGHGTIQQIDMPGEHDHEHEHGHDHGHTGPEADAKHAGMLAPIADCDVLIARGMGRGAWMSLEAAGVEPVITNIHDIEEAVQAYIDGTITNHVEKLH